MAGTGRKARKKGEIIPYWSCKHRKSERFISGEVELNGKAAVIRRKTQGMGGSWPLEEEGGEIGEGLKKKKRHRRNQLSRVSILR